MKKLLWALALSILIPVGATEAQTAAPTVPGYQSVNHCPGGTNSCWYPSNGSVAVVGTQTGVSIVSATGLTVPTGANIAIITVEGTNNTAGVCVRWRDDGTAPTSTVGNPLSANAVMVYQVVDSSQNPLPIKLIQASGASCTMDVAYYK